MRTFLIILTLLLYSCNYCIAHSNNQNDNIFYQKQLNETGFKILNANNITNRMNFRYKDSPKLKISTSLMKKNIYVYKGAFELVEDENELAALLCREISYLNNASNGLLRRTSMSYSPLKYEKKADRRAVDYMVNAGYNPISLIIFLNKRTGEPKWFEQYFISHNGLKRQLYTYEYIYEKYPSFIAQNNYLKNPYYQNFLRNSISERKEIYEATKLKLKIKDETN